MNLHVHSSPKEMRRAIAEYFEFSNHRRYHERIGNIAPADAYYGWREAIQKRREEQKRVTLEERFRYNRSRWNQKTMCKLSLEP